jgi:hypothetical protein
LEGEFGVDNLYDLKGGYKVRELQLFKRTFPVTGSKELHSATYFIHKGKIFSVDPETGKPSRCNFGADYLNSRYKQTFEPLDKQYQFYDEAAANAKLAEGRVLFTKDNIEIDRELFIEDDHINAYVGLYLDVDARFSTSTYGTDDYVNAYANYFPATEELEVGYTLIKADGSDSDFVAVEITDSEKAAILEKLREAGLDECVAEMEQDTDPDEDAGMTLM